MIVTVTANPSLDRTIELSSSLERGEVQRSLSGSEQPGGKGVNVSRALIASRLETVAILPGADTDPMLITLRAAHTPTAGVPIAGRVRSNVTITEPDGTTTKINEPGPQLTAADDAALIELVVAHARHADWVVLAGSLPPGLSVDFYVRVVRAIRSAIARAVPRIAIDSSGAPMQAVMDSDVEIDLIKPNAEELAELTGLPDTFEDDPDAAAAAALGLVERGCRAVLATLGSRGALLVTADATWRATMPPVAAKSTVGAGDASLAGYLLADQRGEPSERRLAQAVAHGAAAASLPGSTMPTTESTHPQRADVHLLDRTSTP